jgi:hypothetical protein
MPALEGGVGAVAAGALRLVSGGRRADVVGDVEPGG